MKLSESQRRILANLTQIPGASIKDIAAAARVKEHAARYALQYFLKSGLIQPVHMINPMPLGLRAFNIFFSIHSTRVAAAIKLLAADPHVSWLTEQEGNPRYEVTVLIKDPLELMQLLDHIGSESGVTLCDRQWAIEVSYHYFGERYLGVNGVKPIHTFEVKGRIKDSCQLSQIDLEILDQLRGSKESRMASLAQLSRHLKHPSTTLAYRVERLSKAGVLSPRFYLLDPEIAGLSQYQVVVSFASIDRAVHTGLLDFCGTQPTVTTLIKGFGSWDYKMVVQGENANDALQVRDQFERRFGSSISEINLLARRRIISTRMKLTKHPELMELIGTH